MPKDKSQNILAALCYILWPVAVILLIIEETKKPKDREPLFRYHGWNATGFAVAVFILSILVMIVAWIPIIGWAIGVLFWIAVLIIAIIYALDAYNGKKVDIPYVTQFLKRSIKGF